MSKTAEEYADEYDREYNNHDRDESIRELRVRLYKEALSQQLPEGEEPEPDRVQLQKEDDFNASVLVRIEHGQGACIPRLALIHTADVTVAARTKEILEAMCDELRAEGRKKVLKEALERLHDARQSLMMHQTNPWHVFDIALKVVRELRSKGATP